MKGVERAERFYLGAGEHSTHFAYAAVKRAAPRSVLGAAR